MPELNERVSDELVEKLAVSIFDMDSDNDAVPWERQPGRVRTQTRRTVRSVLNAIAIHAPELQQRRASVVTPDHKWVQNLAARISVDVCEIERDSPEDDPMACVVYAPEIDAIVVRRVTEALAALSVVSHETGDGEHKTLPERCPECSLHWDHNPPAIISGSDQVRCIECKSIFPAPTDETQGVKREDVVRQTPESFSGRFVGMTPHSQGQWVAYAEHLSQLEAVERERDIWKSTADAVGRYSADERARADIAEASLAAMREALEPFATYMQDGNDLDNNGAPLPDNEGVGWVYLTQADFRRARAAFAAGENDGADHHDYDDPDCRYYRDGSGRPAPYPNGMTKAQWDAGPAADSAERAKHLPED